jgi:hypothetical protein
MTDQFGDEHTRDADRAFSSQPIDPVWGNIPPGPARRATLRALEEQDRHQRRLRELGLDHVSRLIDAGQAQWDDRIVPPILAELPDLEDWTLMLLNERGQALDRMSADHNVRAEAMEAWEATEAEIDAAPQRLSEFWKWQRRKWNARTAQLNEEMRRVADTRQRRRDWLIAKYVEYSIRSDPGRAADDLQLQARHLDDQVLEVTVWGLGEHVEQQLDVADGPGLAASPPEAGQIENEAEIPSTVPLDALSSNSETAEVELSEYERTLRATLTDWVMGYRADHHGQDTTLRGLVTLHGENYQTWRTRIRRHPNIVGPRLGWADGDAIAQRHIAPANSHGSKK